MKTKQTKTSEYKGYYISGDHECWCLAKRVDEWGIGQETIEEYMNDEKVLIYPHEFFPKKGRDKRVVYNIKIIVEMEEVLSE